MVQTAFTNSGKWLKLDKQVKNEKELIRFEEKFTKNYGESTSEGMYDHLKDLNLIHPSYRTLAENKKKALRSMGRRMSDQLGFTHERKYDPRSKQYRTFWRHKNV
ncbi:hypothetical protein [Methanobacterium paludis]|uniref:Uncharacterized protein n=1 Tax=Methanobacterium paludis (strain DSM 25820 / JCM 18151 / SWAN1) TaxID=868131 RepID=F6D2V1_METPW|nr:hypothetical protein [Methanobacterium paludis]AEG18680.1 hypothetical protein MSWAN_1669 [Methanobacterium paludis]